MQTIYLISLLTYIPIWLYMYVSISKQNKKEMLFMSFLNAGISPISSFLWWNKDWWLPPSIIGTYPIIPEDILIGFLFGGIASVIYEFYFHKKVKRGEVSHIRSFWFLAALVLLLCAGLFSIVKLNSFYSIIISITFALCAVLYIRKDLIKSSLYSGLLTLIICIPFYAVIHFLSPLWALATYKYAYLSGITIYNFPIEEFIFWFFYGLIIGPAYEYIKGWTYK